MSRRVLSILLVLLLIVVVLWVATPVFLIMPFRSQEPWMIAVSHFLRAWAPWVTAVGLAVAAGLVFKVWQLAAGSWQLAAT
jgi:hypothetical protein